tara:strand:- start:69 stop:644 length:576 start_codon:yes stop_codon:yes gene_type:complete
LVKIILFLVCFLLNTVLVYSCPSFESLLENKKWVEHTTSVTREIKEVLTNHFIMPISPEKGSVSMLWTPVKVKRGKGIQEWREIVWAVHRTYQTNFNKEKKTCFVSGSVAYYVEVKNKNGWPPTIDFLNTSDEEKQLFEDGIFGLIELRWYNSKTKKKHRWFSVALAKYLGWVQEYQVSPILLPRVINSLD